MLTKSHIYFELNTLQKPELNISLKLLLLKRTALVGAI